MSNTIVSNLITDKLYGRSIVTNISLISLGAALTALAAQITVPMFPVPMTMQTFAVLLVAATLGAGRGAASLSLYLVAGAAGLPVFAGAASLTGVLPTAGYLVGFVFAGALVGFLAKIGWSKTVHGVAASFAIGSIVIYAFGVTGLMITLGLSFSQALAAGVAPFLLGDLLKAALAATLLPAAWKLIK